jgi:hypothetical protein
MTSSTPTMDQLLDLADAVAADGVAAHRQAVDDLVGWARARGLRPVLLEVLEDPAVPDAVHQRALGRLIVVAGALGEHERRSGGDADRGGPVRPLAAA